MAWKALRLMSEKQRSVEWPWWFRNPPLSRLPCCRRHWKDKDLESQAVKRHLGRENWTLAHCYFANMGGFLYVVRKKRLLVAAQQLIEDSSYIHPEITNKDIEDKSKQDWLAKLFAALQILQLILSIINAAYSRCTIFRSLRQSHYSLLFAARLYTALTFTSLKNLNGH